MKTKAFLSLLALVILISTRFASAAAFTWDTVGQPSGGDWNTGANWGGTAPNANTADATIGTLTAASAVNLSSPATVNSLTLTSTNDMSVTGSTLTFGGTTSGTTVLTSSGAGNKTISAPVIISNIGANITTSAGSGSLTLGNLNYSAGSGFLNLLPANGTAINVTGSITNPTRGFQIGSSTASTGAVTFSGNNTYGGTTILNAVQLNINSATALGSSAFWFANSSGVIDNTSAGAITLTNNNAISIRANFTFVGTKNLNLGTGAVDFNATTGTTQTVTVSNGILTFGGNFTGSTTNLGLTKAGNGTLVLAGNISLSGQTTTKLLTISGGTVTLSGNNSASAGGVTVNTNTTLNVNNNNALGSGTLDITTGILDNTSGSKVTVAGNNAQVWRGGGFTFTGTNALDLGTGTVSLGVTTVPVSRTIGVGGSGANGTLTVGGVISDGGSFAGGITKSGTGTLVLAGNNTYTGLTTLGGGTLTLSGDNHLASGGVTVSGGTTLNVNNANALGSGTLTMNGGTLDNTSAGAITVAGNNAQTWGGNITFTGTKDLNLGTGAVALGGTTRTVTVNAGVLTVGGTISNGGIQKSGAGTVVLTGASDYASGTTVSVGTLLVNNAGGSGTGTGTVSVSGGATLGGAGTISGATTISGIASPGLSGSIGTLTFGNNVTWNGGATAGATTDWVFQLGASNASDMLAVNGNFIKGTGSVFRFDLAGSTATGTFKLIDVIGGTNNFTADNFSYTNYSGVNTPTFSIVNNDVYLTAVPEPATWGLLAFSLTTVLVFRRPRIAAK